MQCDILHVDETFIKQLVKGAKECKQAYLWCRLTGVGPPMIAYHFSPSRSRDVAESLLGDYSGTIIRDSYAAYEKLDCEVTCCSYETEFMGDGRKLSFSWRYSFSLNEIMYRYIGFGFILPYEATKQSSSINNCSIWTTPNFLLVQIQTCCMRIKHFQIFTKAAFGLIR